MDEFLADGPLRYHPAVNILLVERHELDPDGRARLVDRRANHAHAVLHAQPGQTLEAGLVDGPLGTAVVEACTADELTVRASFDRPAPPAEHVLLLAVPRPKVLLRMLAHAAALGFRQIVLFRSWRVDKSHLDSTAMDPEIQREHLLLGLEQARRTRLPQVLTFPLFKPMVEDALPQLDLPAQRFVAHPRAACGTDELALARTAPFALALGPDGGFLPYEIERFTAAGFLPIHCGPHPLRTESALSVLTGQLELLRRRGSLPQ
jgi:RsmE family RNA methyltransferase